VDGPGLDVLKELYAKKKSGAVATDNPDAVGQ
jgi:hypothetical protein